MNTGWWNDIDSLSTKQLVQEFNVSQKGLDRLDLEAYIVMVFDYTYYQIMGTRNSVGYVTGRYTKKEFKQFLKQNGYCNKAKATV